jgi:acetyl esterase
MSVVVRWRKQAGKSLIQGFFAGAARVGRLHPQANPDRHGVEVVRDVAYLPSGLAEHRLDIWRPRHRPGPLPTVLYVHGGGFMIGSLASHAPTCRALAAALGWRVLAVTYRRAPEARYPAAPLDGLAAYAHVLAHRGDFGLEEAAPRVVVAGDSAGGQLALELGLRVRDANRAAAAGASSLSSSSSSLPPPLLPPVLLVPIYPVINSFVAWPSRARFAAGFGALTEPLLRRFLDAYLGTEPEALAAHSRDAYLCPDQQADLSGLPPIVLLTAQYDMLCDEGVAFVATARARGAKVEHVHAEGRLHACVQHLASVPSNRALLESLAAVVKARVEGGRAETSTPSQRRRRGSRPGAA